MRIDKAVNGFTIHNDTGDWCDERQVYVFLTWDDVIVWLKNNPIEDKPVEPAN